MWPNRANSDAKSKLQEDSLQEDSSKTLRFTPPSAHSAAFGNQHSNPTALMRVFLAAPARFQPLSKASSGFKTAPEPETKQYSEQTQLRPPLPPRGVENHDTLPATKTVRVSQSQKINNTRVIRKNGPTREISSDRRFRAFPEILKVALTKPHQANMVR